MTRLIKAELFKLQKRSMTRILLFVMVGIIVVLYLILLAVSKANIPAHATEQGTGNIENLLGLPLAIPFALSLLATFGSVMAVILLASSMGNEYNWRTIRTIIISSESRTKLLAAKLISAAIYILLGMFIGVAAGFIMSLITTAIGGYKFVFTFATGQYFWDQFVQFWWTFFIILPYVLLAFLFAIVGRSAMPGIAVSIGVFFLESIITALMYAAGGWVAQVPAYLINANFSAINSLNGLPGRMGGAMADLSNAPTILHAAVTLAIYTIVFGAIAFYLFRKRDVTA